MRQVPMRRSASATSWADTVPGGGARGITPRRPGGPARLARVAWIAGTLALGPGVVCEARAASASDSGGTSGQTSAPLPPARPSAEAAPRSSAKPAGAKPAGSKASADKSGGSKSEGSKSGDSKSGDSKSGASNPGASKAAPARSAGPTPPKPIPARSTASARTGSGRMPRGGAPLPLPRPAELVALDEAAQAAERQASAAPSAPAPFAMPPFFAPQPQPAEEREKEPPKDAEKPVHPPQPPERPAASGDKTPGLPAPCAALVEEGVIAAEPETHLEIKDGCSLPSPVRFSAIRLKDGRLIPLKPAAILRCETVAAVAEWVREDLAAAVDSLGAPLAAVEVAASFACRPRNNVKGAKVSEHGFGNALDVGGFETTGPGTLEVKNGGLPVAFQEQMKSSACKRFATVLGPGSDGYHEDHIHVDLAKRRNAYKMCRWVIKEKPAPLPQARPAEATAETSSASGASPAAPDKGRKSGAKGAASDGTKKKPAGG